MSKDEFQKLNQFILGELDKVSKEDSPIFRTTTTQLAKKMNYDIPFLKGHHAFYKMFMKNKVSTYKIDIHRWKPISDIKFELWFTKLN